MQARKFITAMLIVTFCLIGGVLAGSASDSSQPQAQLALQQLQADFHGAATLGDYDLMLSLWTDDAVANVAGSTYYGPTEIADFFSSSPYWGVSASLAPTYKGTYEIHGNTATIQFECVIVHTGGFDPLTTPLSTIPFGGQNPVVEIVQHSTATITAEKRGGTWLIKTFNGSAGPA